MDKNINLSDTPAAQLSRAFVGVVAGFITSLLIANIIAVKLIEVRGWVLPAGIIIFTISYILADVLTEVYGYRRARQAIWLGFACNLLAVAAIALAQTLPPADFWDGQAAYDEAAVTPLTYQVVHALKRQEGIDVYDTETDFNPLKIKQRS
jgi:uncharacterized integral membrane protein (TIGR00697 family)